MSASRALKVVTVVGSGLMGSGIAQVSASGGFDVHLCDVQEQALQNSQKNIKLSLTKLAAKQFQNDSTAISKYVDEVLARIKFSTDHAAAASTSDLIIEAIIENIDTKHKLFKSLDEAAPAHTLFASNTSSLSITKIASVTKRLSQFGGLHFFSPVPIMKLVEVIRTKEISNEAFDSLMEFSRNIGKTPIECKDTPGFVVNRLLIPYTSEAVRLLERGDAKAEDIDTAMRLGAGYTLGPIELSDFVGLDVSKYVVDIFHKEFPNNPLFEPSPLVNKLVAENKLGRKTGEGFYSYTSKGNRERKPKL